MMRRWDRGCWRRCLVGLGALTLAACGTSPSSVSSGQPAMMIGRWSEAEARRTAMEMMKEAVGQPWVQRFQQAAGRPPVVTVGTVTSRSQDPTEIQTFIKELERALTNTDKVRFVANAAPPAGRPLPPGQTAQADFVVQGAMMPAVDARDSVKGVSHQVTLEVLDLAGNVQVWSGNKAFLKSDGV